MILLRNKWTFFLWTLLLSCNSPERKNEQNDLAEIMEVEAPKDSVVPEPDIAVTIKGKPSYESVPDTGFVVMNNYADGFAYDMKYATEENFLETRVYPCEQCLLRKEVAAALREANEKLTSRGLRIKFYDCYRPLDVQKQMWEIFPNPLYVANPNTTVGSIHNRGGAVDITLITLDGQELDMGTGFDHFGKEAHHAYANLQDTVLANRRLLKETMEAYGFKSITSEWWHYSFKAAGKYSVSNFSVKCD